MVNLAELWLKHTWVDIIRLWGKRPVIEKDPYQLEHDFHLNVLHPGLSVSSADRPC